VATNVDPTVPSARGPLPGNGSLVAALRYATGAKPTVTGKPEPTMHQESVIRSNAHAPIVVGDRLDTDVEGANAVGCPSLLVLTGVTEPAHLITAPARMRPTYLAADLTGLLTAHRQPSRAGEWWACRGWRARTRTGRLELATAHGDGTSQPGAENTEGLDALRALCEAAWHDHVEDGATIHATDDATRAELMRLRLPQSED
jgi:hypothetical protein